jgi:hypothetical protein
MQHILLMSMSLKFSAKKTRSNCISTIVMRYQEFQ